MRDIQRIQQNTNYAMLSCRYCCYHYYPSRKTRSNYICQGIKYIESPVYFTLTLLEEIAGVGNKDKSKKQNACTNMQILHQKAVIFVKFIEMIEILGILLIPAMPLIYMYFLCWL